VQLVAKKMPHKPKPKPKRKSGMTQKQRFIEAAKSAEVDGDAFERVFNEIVPPKRATNRGAPKRS
jgi:hypothetical protein